MLKPITSDENGHTLYEVLEGRNGPTICVEYDDPPDAKWGHFVRTVNGVSSIADESFWAIMLGDNFTDGVDKQSVNEGEVYTFQLTHIIKDYKD